MSDDRRRWTFVRAGRAVGGRPVFRGLLCALLCACGEGGAQSVQSGGTQRIDLAGREFLLESADGFNAEPGSTVQISFDADQLDLFAGCNSMQGHYRVDGERLTVTAVDATENECEPDEHRQDERLADLLATPLEVALDGRLLELRTGGVVLRFRAYTLPSVARPLVDTHWTVNTVFTLNEALRLSLNPTPWVQFAADGGVEIQGACQRGSGRYEVHGYRITLKAVSYSGASCSDPAADEVERAIQTVLDQGTLTYELELKFVSFKRRGLTISASTL